jgi:ribonuclease T
MPMEASESITTAVIPTKSAVARRFRGFLPVVVDVETGGFNPATDALLEIAAVILTINEQGKWCREQTIAYHIKPFQGANLDKAALKFNGIDPFHPFRLAITEQDALKRIFLAVRKAVETHGCTRAILVGHNSFFDLSFLKAAVERNRIKHNPFHAFSTFDTVSLAGLAYGQTVLSRALTTAGFSWNNAEAHSAIYDAEQTAELFCAIVNEWDRSNVRAPDAAGGEMNGIGDELDGSEN